MQVDVGVFIQGLLHCFRFVGGKIVCDDEGLFPPRVGMDSSVDEWNHFPLDLDASKGPKSDPSSVHVTRFAG